MHSAFHRPSPIPLVVGMAYWSICLAPSRKVSPTHIFSFLTKQKKCDMYWPKEGTEIYGVIQVKLQKEEVMATYTVRTFQLRHLKVGLSPNKISLLHKPLDSSQHTHEALIMYWTYARS